MSNNSRARAFCALGGFKDLVIKKPGFFSKIGIFVKTQKYA
jgi:hypothetical protein